LRETLVDALFPALSTQVPAIVAFAESGPEYANAALGVHDCTPEIASSSSATPTGWLYQPFASGGRAKLMLAVGVEVSTWTVYGWTTVVPPDQFTTHETVRSVSVV
jgi:hypothetical protein